MAIMEGGQLTQAQIARVLRRAADLDRGRGEDGCLDSAAVEAAAVEAGLSSESVSQALAELRVGALEPVPPGRNKVLGPSSLTLQRVVPGPRSSVDSAVRSWLSGQLFEQRRLFGHRELWVRREGMWTSLRRSLDVNHRLALNGVGHVEFALAEPPDGNGQVLVRLQADVGDQRSAHAWCIAGAAVAASGAAGALLVVDPITLIASLPVGTGVTFGAHVTGRSYYRREVGKIEHALAGLLDRLEHHPRTTAEASRFGS